MNERSDAPKIEDVSQRIEEAIKAGRIDAELASRQEARKAAIKSIVEAEQVDPRKLRRPVTI